MMVYGMSLILAFLYVYYRDLNWIWEVIIQMGFFLSPIVCSLSAVPEEYLPYYMLNPVIVVIQMHRDILLYHTKPAYGKLAFSFLVGGAIILLGSDTFKRQERRFVEEM